MASADLIPQVWEVPQVFRERVGRSPGRQRLMESAGHLLLVLHRTPQPDQDQRLAVFFWRSPDGQWSSSEFGSGIAGLESHLAEYEQGIDYWETQETRAQSADGYFQVIDHLAPVHRAVRNLHGVLQEARQQAREDRGLINVRDRAYELNRRAELLFNAAQIGLNYAIARRAEEQAASSHRMAQAAHRLNLLAAFFFPLATLSAVFGMNLKLGLEEAATPGGFLAVLAVGLGLGAGLMAVVNRRAKRPTD